MKKKKYNLKEQKEIVDDVMEQFEAGKNSITDACKGYGIEAHDYYNWKRKFAVAAKEAQNPTVQLVTPPKIIVRKAAEVATKATPRAIVQGTGHPKYAAIFTDDEKSLASLLSRMF